MVRGAILLAPFHSLVPSCCLQYFGAYYPNARTAKISPFQSGLRPARCGPCCPTVHPAGSQALVLVLVLSESPCPPHHLLRLLALHPDVDLSKTRDYSEYIRILAGLVQASWG